jgi:uncharacterized protein
MLQAQIFIDLEERKSDQPLHDFIMKFLSEKGISGATSFRAYAGFGKNHKIKWPNDLFSFDEPPVMILFIDDDTIVKNVLTELRTQINGGLITLTPVQK